MQNIALIAESFISEKLLETLAKHDVPVYSTTDTPSIPNRVDKDRVIELLSKDGEKLIYTNAEDVLPIIIESTGNEELKNSIKLFKNKAFLKGFLQGIEPQTHFTELKIGELGSFKPPQGRALIVKPSTGFMSLGIRRINKAEEWDETVKEILGELKQSEGMFHHTVLKSDTFLVEDYIEGDEYACDGYYDADGEPVILFILKHPFRDLDDNRDLLYYTTSEIMEEFLPKVTDFMRRISKKQKIRCFPFHFEFRIRDGDMYVMEVNPMRFAGFGGADLNYYGFGVNSYEFYLELKKPNWDEILPKHRGKCYAYVFGRAPLETKGKEPDHEAFKATFKKILRYGIIDHTRYPCFCGVAAEGDSLEEFKKYLTMDFSQFFK